MNRSKLGLFAPGPKVYDSLMRYPCVVDWIEGYDSHFTKDHFLRAFYLFVRHTGMTPDELLTLKPQEAKQKLVAFARSIRDQGKSSWAFSIVKSVKSFYRHHGVELKLQRTEKIRVARKRVNVEIIPSKEQVYKMADFAGNLRDKAIILCLWQSGVRIGCLNKWTFGLVKDQVFPSDNQMKIPVYLRITESVDTKLRSYDVGYYCTFLGREATEALRDYLKWRMDNGEKLMPDSPVFASHATTIRGTPLSSGSIRDIIKRCAKNAGIDPERIWTHCLRKAFRKVLNNSDIDEDTREALMGHKLPGSRGSYFDSHDVEEIARKYMRCNFARTEAMPEDVRKEMLLLLWRDQAKMFGIDPMKIKIEKEKVLGRKPNTEEEIEAIQMEIKKIVISPMKQKEESNDCNGKPYMSKIICEKELVPYVEEGWEIVKELTNGNFLIKKPNHATI